MSSRNAVKHAMKICIFGSGAIGGTRQSGNHRADLGRITTVLHHAEVLALIDADLGKPAIASRQ
jgi:hypothetical protein